MLKNVEREQNSQIVDPISEEPIKEVEKVKEETKTEIVTKRDPEKEIDVIKVADELQQKLIAYSHDKDMGRKEILNYLGGMFLASRAKSSILIEKAREKAINSLLDKMETMNAAQLIRALETLSKLGESDAFIFSGTAKPGSGNSINIFNGAGSPSSGEDSRTVGDVEVKDIKKADSILNAISIIAANINKSNKQIEAEPRDLTPASDAKIIDVPNE